MYIEYCYGPKWPYLIYIAYIGLFGTGICRFIQVLYLGRAPRTKETLPDFREKCRVTRHSRVFHGLTGSQRTPGFWGVTGRAPRTNETLPDFLKWRPVTRHLLVFRGLTGSQRTPGFRASHISLLFDPHIVKIGEDYPIGNTSTLHIMQKFLLLLGC